MSNWLDHSGNIVESLPDALGRQDRGRYVSFLLFSCLVVPERIYLGFSSSTRSSQQGCMALLMHLVGRRQLDRFGAAEEACIYNYIDSFCLATVS